MAQVTCCACGRVVESVPEAIEKGWYPTVFYLDDPLGELCPDCAEEIGVRDAKEGEEYGNKRIVSYETFLDIREGDRQPGSSE